MKNATEILSDLVAIPSYVSKDSNEKLIVQYIERFLAPMKPKMTLTELAPERSNLLVKFGDSETKLFFGCHLDTVPPWSVGKYKPFEPVVVGNLLYGLGAVDMKGGIAALLYSLSQTEVGKLDGLAILFDIDEEYDFMGMQEFVKNQTLTFAEDALAIFTEPNLSICNAHRGLIELNFEVKGESAHASKAISGNKDQGINAILGATTAINELRSSLVKFSHPELGQSSCNLAWLEGGSLVNGKIVNQGNRVPDIARFKLDIRPATPELDAETIIQILTGKLENQGLKVTNQATAFDFGALYTPPANLRPFANIVKEIIGKEEYSQLGGYGEAEMFSRAFGVASVYFGPGPGTMAHKADEYVKIDEVETAARVYLKCVTQYCIK